MDRKTMHQTLEGIKNLPTLPVIAMEVNQMLTDEDVTIEKLCEVIEKDPAIATKLLKLVNSAFFGVRSRVGSISEAVIMLGFTAVRNVVLSVSVIDALKVDRQIETFSMADFWKHSIAAAIISKALSEKTRLVSPEEGFLGGLLHDIGKIIMIQFFPEMFEAAWLTSRAGQQTFFEAERQEKSMDHALIGGYLAIKWKLPTEIVDTIKLHHTVEKTASAQNLLIINHTADILANAYVNGNRDKRYLSLLNPEAAAKAKGPIAELNTWFPAVVEEIGAACVFFLKENIG